MNKKLIRDKYLKKDMDKVVDIVLVDEQLDNEHIVAFGVPKELGESIADIVNKAIELDGDEQIRVCCREYEHDYVKIIKEITDRMMSIRIERAMKGK